MINEMMNWKEYGKKVMALLWYFTSICMEGLRKTTINFSGIPAEISTEYLPHISQIPTSPCLITTGHSWIKVTYAHPS
jgi:hypothetical protein